MGDKDFLYTLFSQEYGKIRCTKKIGKQEKPLDIGYHISFEISTQGSSTIHKIRNLKILSEFIPSHNDFSIINSYLETLAYISKQLPDGFIHKEVYHLLSLLNEIPDNYVQKFLLIKGKAKCYFGDLPDTHTHPTIQKILKFIHHSHIEKILLLTGITPELEKELELLF